MRYTKYANTQPREWEDLPWNHKANSLPALPEALAWIFLGGMFVFLCLLLMGVA